MNNLNFVYQQAKEPWYRLRVQPVTYDEQGQVEVCEEDIAFMFSVYMGTPDGRWMCIADLPTKQLAIDLAFLILHVSKQREGKKFEVGDWVEFTDDRLEEWKNVPIVAPIEEINGGLAIIKFSENIRFTKVFSQLKHVPLLVD